jgi:hypothetical protein
MRRISRNRFLRQSAYMLSGTVGFGLSLAVAEDVKVDVQLRCLKAKCTNGKLQARIRLVNRSAFAIEFLVAQITCPLEDCAIEVVDSEGNVVFKEEGNVHDGTGPSELVRLPPRGFFETTVERRIVINPPDFDSVADFGEGATLFLRARVKTGKSAGIRGANDSGTVIQTASQSFLSNKLPVARSN